MKNLFSLLIKPIYWILKNPLDAMLLVVFNMSIIPFFVHKQDYGYGMAAFFTVFIICFSEHLVLKNNKPSTFHNISITLFLIIGLVSLFFVINKPYNRQWLPYENCLVTYVGAFIGALSAHFIISFVDNERKEKQKRQEQHNQHIKSQNEQQKIAEKEKQGYLTIKKNGKLVGFIEQRKYDEFLKNNIEK